MHLLALCLGHNNQVGDLSDLTLGSCVVRLLGNLTGAVQAQGVRNGVKKAGFEGGQMPLQRRLPKRGFNNIFATKYVTIKVSDLEKFEAGATVDAQALLDAGIISKTLDGVKVLGNGELTKAVNVKVAAYTASAKEKIEKAGGKAEVI